MLFAARYQRPNATHFDWSARSFGQDSITIPKSRLHLGNYYIAVYAFTNCSFTIVAHLDGPIDLQDGVPQSAEVSQEASRYFQLQVDDAHRGQICAPSFLNLIACWSPTDIVFTVTPILGSVWLFISNVDQPVVDDWNSYFWYSMTGQPNVVIHRDDRHWCTHCTYYVLVYGETDAVFTIQASTSQAHTQLMNNIPMVRARVRLLVPDCCLCFYSVAGCKLMTTSTSRSTCS